MPRIFENVGVRVLLTVVGKSCLHSKWGECMSFPKQYKPMLDAYYTTCRIGCHESAEAMRRVLWNMYGIVPNDIAPSQQRNDHVNANHAPSGHSTLDTNK